MREFFTIITEIISTGAILSRGTIFTWCIKSKLHPEIERRLTAIGTHIELQITEKIQKRDLNSLELSITNFFKLLIIERSTMVPLYQLVLH